MLLANNVFRVGTRGSKLALIQTEIVLKALRRLHKDLRFEVVPIKTLGDWEQSKSLFYLSRKGVFEKEIDQAVYDGVVDFAVHSLKDVPVQDYEQLVLACVPKRGIPYDVLVSRNGETLSELGTGSLVGTSSLRRVAEVKFVRPDLDVRPVRGNVDTRLAKLGKGDFDALILAEEALRRLGVKSKAIQRLSSPNFLPAAGQGALAVVARDDSPKVTELLKIIEHRPSRAEAMAERTVVSALQGGCRIPIGVLARARISKLSLKASVFSVDGNRRIYYRAESRLDDYIKLGRHVAEVLLSEGAEELAREWRRNKW